MTAPSSIEIDTSQPSLVVVRYHRVPSDEDFEQYLAEYLRLLQSASRVGAVYVTPADLPLTPPRHVRLQARFMKQHGAVIREHVVGVAFALPSPLIRGVLRATLMLQTMPCPHVVVATEAEGVAWVKARLWTDQVRRMKVSGP